MNANSMSITSYISQLAKQNRLFPKKEIVQFCKSKNSQCTQQKYKNIFDSYLYQFRRSYLNFQQIILISSISLQKNQTCLIQNICEFIQDLVTSKMILICVQKKDLKIYERFNYLEKMFNLLIPQILKLKMEKQIMSTLKKCNQSGQKFISINFLLQFLFIQNILDHLSKNSAQKFQMFLKKSLLKEKVNILQRYWKNKSTKKILKLSDLVCLRKDVDDYKVYNLILQKGAIKSQVSKNQPPNWVIQAYKKQITSRDIQFQVNKNTKITEIYKFLMHLQIFLSSPKVEEVEQIIDNSEFLQKVFAKFLQGSQIHKQEYQHSNHEAINYVNEVRGKYQAFSQPYKEILRIQLSKLGPRKKQKQLNALETKKPK